jgi:autotransporter passenger strand-loop-strand repeat protein
MSNFNVFNTTVSGFVLHNGDRMNIGSGGTADDTTVSSGAIDVVSVGGSAVGTVVNGAREFVGSGGSATSTAVVDNGEQDVFVGGVASGTFLNGGFQEVLGTAIGTTFFASNSSTQLVFAGGSALGDTVTGLGNTVSVFTGGYISDAIVKGGAVINLDGSASHTVLSAVLSAGVLFDSTLFVNEGGRATGTVVNSGAQEFVASGGSESGATVYSGGLLEVFGATSGTVLSGGEEDVGLTFNEEGVVSATGTTVYHGGVQNVFLGGFASGTVLSGGVESVFSGGSATGATVYSGGVETVLSGGVISDTTINSGGEGDVYGSAIGTVLSGGAEIVFAGGSGTGATVDSGGVETVSSGGTISGTTVNSGGSDDVYGSDSGTALSGGAEIVYTGGSATSTTVDSGGVQTVSSGGTISGTTVNSGGLLDLIGGAIVTGSPILNSGSTEKIEQGYSVSNFRVGNGVTLIVGSGGVAGNTSVGSGGVMEVLQGGNATGKPDVTGTLIVESGGTVSSPNVRSGGLLELVGGAIVSGTPNLNAGSTEEIERGYVVSNAKAGNGVTLIVGSGGVASNTSINSAAQGGGVVVSGGGIASGSIINNHGQQVLIGGPGGAASAAFTQIKSGGVETVSSGGVDLSATVSSGGDLVVSSGGVVSGAAIQRGGLEVVSSGGSTSDTTVSSGGTIELMGGAQVNGALNINSGGIVEIGSGYVISNAMVASRTLEVASGGLVSNTTVSGGGTLIVLSGGHADPTTILSGGSETVSAGGEDDGALISGGTQYVYGSASGTTVFNGGTQVVESGGTVSHTTISSGILELASGGTVSGDIIFASSGGNLTVDGAAMPANTIDGFVAGDTIDLSSITNSAGSHVDMDYTTDVLTVTEGSNTYQFHFNPTESFAGDFFHLAADGNGTQITEDQIACYLRGTLIATEHGEVPVERLAIGDDVLTASGVSRPIKWIGTRAYAGRFIMGRKDILPVCFKAGALGENVPKRDLWISPHHAMYFENQSGGVLIEARDLVNGASIVQAEQADEVEYFHIELETHDVILAEGALSETFVDDESRGMFHNAYEYSALYTDEEMTPARYCAPRLDQGYEVEAVRQRLALRAGLLPAADRPSAGVLRGCVDLVSATCIAGWAQNIGYAEVPVCLDIVVGGRLIGQVLANRYRDDLEHAGLGSGRHSFSFAVPNGPMLLPGTIEVRRSLDGARLPASKGFELGRAVA